MAYFFTIFVSTCCDLFSFAVIARILFSWFPNSGAHQIKSFLRDVTEPYLAFFRNLIPRAGMLDISPIIALIALDVIKGILLFLVTKFFS